MRDKRYIRNDVIDLNSRYYNQNKKNKKIILGIIAAVVLIGLLSIFGKDLITGLMIYDQQYQIMGSTKLWNNTFDTTGKDSGVWQVYANAVADWFYPASIDDRNFTLSAVTYEVALYWPGNNTNIIDRYVNFTWYNITWDKIPTTYHILVDNDSDFSSPVINVSSITETGPTFSNYTSAVELELSTSYYWKVRASNGTYYSEFSDVWNFSIMPYKAITLIVANVSFGEMAWNSSDTTEDNNPYPIFVENTGNVPVNITFNASALWISAAAPNDYYLFKAGVNESGSFNESASVTIWTQVPLTSATPHIFDLGYIDTNDTVEIELNVTVPPNELAGVKSSDILVSS